MTLYHGSFESVTQPEIRVSKFEKDFGQGFYCTQIKQQAERWAERFETPMVNLYQYSPNPGLKILDFPQMTDEWLDFIAACRNGKPHSYDLVSGAMANDQVWNYVADFISGVLTREQFWALAKFKHPTHQIAFCSPESLKCITYLKSYMVKEPKYGR
jgi:hypothetical protein